LCVIECRGAYGCAKGLFGLYQGTIKALLRLYYGSIKALSRLY
jgi:hypothetical protein